MRATAPADPAAAIEDEDEWVVELLWRGERVLVTAEPGDVRVHAADGREITGGPAGRAASRPSDRFPGSSLRRRARGGGCRRPAHRRGRTGWPNVWWRRARRRGGGSREKHPVAFLAFDLLWLEGHAVTQLPWHERRALLEEIGLAGPSWQTPAVHYGDPAPIMEAAAGNGLPGVVLKQTESSYEPGGTTPDWLEVGFGS